MSLHTRRILYIFFILAFLIITPLVILYASGYDLRGGFNIKKTGMLVVNSQPRGAKIFINGKPQKIFFRQLFTGQSAHLTTPAKIKNITPASYDIQLVLPNYWPWEKRLTIWPGETTYAEDVVLFKKNTPKLLYNYDNGLMVVSPHPPAILIISAGKLFRFTDNNEKIAELTFSTSTAAKFATAEGISWSPNNEKFLIGRLLFDLKRKKMTDLTARINRQAKQLTWDYVSNDYLYYRLNNDIHRYDLNLDTDEIIVNDCRCYAFLPKNGKINLAINQEKPQKPNAAADIVIEAFAVPASDYLFFKAEVDWLNLYDGKNKRLYLIDPVAEIKPLNDIINDVSKVFWIDAKRLLYTNDHEIWLTNVDKTAKTLLTRVSRPIIDIFWHPSNNYIIFTTDKDINILELDDREKHNIIKILEADLIQKTFMTADGSTLYFYGRLKNQEGLYKLSI